MAQKYLSSYITPGQFQCAFEHLTIDPSTVPFTQRYQLNGFIGRIKKDRFYIFYQTAYVSNSFTTVLRGKIANTPAGINIAYHYSKFHLVQVILSSCIAFQLALLLFLSKNWAERLSAIVFSLIPYGIVIFLLKFSTRRARDRLSKVLHDISFVS